MNVDKRAIIIGMALGDGYVQVRTRYNGSTAYESRSMRVLHGADQRAYCEWKAVRLGWALGGRQINVHPYKNGPGLKYKAYGFNVSHPYFGQVRKWLYPRGQKLFTQRVLDMLSPEALAIWYMDDGSARRNLDKKGFVTSVSTDIATMCSETEAVVIRDWLKERFDLGFKVRCNKRCTKGKQFYIQCNTMESKKFIDLIHPHVPECMMYKVAHVAAYVSHERQTPVAHCPCGAVIYDRRRKGMCVKCYTRQHKTGDDIVRPNGN